MPTLTVESSRSDHRAQAQQLLSYVLKKQRDEPLTKPTFRIGLSGSPGVGKSTFIEVYGLGQVPARLFFN